jgi:hypothetical protein
MDTSDLLVKKYIKERLSNNPELVPYISKTSILLTEDDPGLVWDFLILLPDELFSEFSARYSDCFVIDDHEYDPWVFTKVKSLGWIVKDFQKRLPIALWIYQHSMIIQDKDKQFSNILDRQKERFAELFPEILQKKYIEFRTERHNLRHAIKRENAIAIALIKATVVKLSFEMSFLAEGKPYPYKKWLPIFVQRGTGKKAELYNISQDFLDTKEAERSIELSNQLVEKTISLLNETKVLEDDILQRWWLYLK